MTGSRLVLWLSRGVLVGAASLWAFVGCSRQSEGERCDRVAAGDTDCNDGLKCVACVKLARGVVDRCCPAAGAETTSECQRSANENDRAAVCSPATGGTAGTTGRGGSSNGGTNASGGSDNMSGSGGSGVTGGSGGSGATSGEAGADQGGSGGT